MAVIFRLSAVLESVGMSQRELSRRSGVSLVTVNAIANNGTTRVDLSTIDKICEALECEPGELLERETRRPKRAKR